MINQRQNHSTDESGATPGELSDRDESIQNNRNSQDDGPYRSGRDLADAVERYYGIPVDYVAPVKLVDPSVAERKLLG